MRILVASTGNSGHFSPLIPLASACADAGHDVRVAVPSAFAGEAGATGLVIDPFDDPPPEQLGPVFATIERRMQQSRTVPTDPALRAEADATIVREVWGRIDARAALPRMREIVDGWRPELIVREPAEIASLIVAETHGVRHVQGGIGTVGMHQFIGRLFAEPFAGFEQETGLPSGHLVTAALTAPLFTRTPASFDLGEPARPAPRGIHRFRVDEATGPSTPALPDWGDPAAPLVYVTFGTVAATMPFGGLFRVVIDALADLDVRVLLTTGRAGSPDSLRPWPPNVRVVQWWPQAALMPHAAAVVGHGGFGTTMTALSAGVPQVVIPLFAGDQWVNADRIAECGAGIRLDVGPDLVGELPRAVRAVLDDPGIRRSAETVRDEIDGLPGPAEVLDALIRA